jgi:hypothetical protein
LYEERCDRGRHEAKGLHYLLQESKEIQIRSKLALVAK